MRTFLNQQPTSQALRFVLMIGIVSLFADATYEGSRSITGPFLALLGATGAAVSIIAGSGELLGYGLRLVSGRVSERTGKFWTIILFGYTVQMLAVPALAFAGSWQVAALLIVLERVGKAIRNPPRDVMLSHAGKIIGFGWAFGLNKALDQLGACIGPLCIAFVLAMHGKYQTAFAMLLIPALLTLGLVVTARLLYPRPEEMNPEIPDLNAANLPRLFWVYLAGAALVAAGFPDFSLMAYHFGKTGSLPASWIPVFYSLAMGTSGVGSLICGKIFDRRGIMILIPLTAITLLSVPLAFLGGFFGAFVGCALWGLGIGVHDTIIPAVVAKMVPLNRRASAYGIFTSMYGVSWFLGSVVIGLLYDVSLPALVCFSVALDLAAIPFFFLVAKASRPRLA